ALLSRRCWLSTPATPATSRTSCTKARGSARRSTPSPRGSWSLLAQRPLEVVLEAVAAYARSQSCVDRERHDIHITDSRPLHVTEGDGAEVGIFIAARFAEAVEEVGESRQVRRDAGHRDRAGKRSLITRAGAGSRGRACRGAGRARSCARCPGVCIRGTR